MTKRWQPLPQRRTAFFNLKRKRTHDLRQIVDAILWLLKTGCQWRNLPPQWPHWQAVYYYFDQWKQANLWTHINATLNEQDRQRSGRRALPSAICVDSQSVKLHPMIWEDRGFDAHKCVNGRKRQLLVDTQGRIWVVGVHAAGQGDGPAAVELVGDLLWRMGESVEKVFGDQAYNGVFAQALADWGICFERASRSESSWGFVPVAKRWVVERSIAWTNFLPVRPLGLGASKIPGFGSLPAVNQSGVR